MFSDAYNIIITAFALFGLYSFIDGVIMYLRYGRGAQTVTVIKYEDEYSVLNTIEYLNNALYNNSVVVVSDQKTDSPVIPIVTLDELHKYITNALFTKN